MISEVYEPLKDAGASEEKAKAAAQALADYENRFAGLETGQMLLKWMLGFNLTFTMAILWKVLQQYLCLIHGGVGMKTITASEFELINWVYGQVRKQL